MKIKSGKKPNSYQYVIYLPISIIFKCLTKNYLLLILFFSYTKVYYPF